MAIVLLLLQSVCSAGMTPAEILKEADRARGNLEGVVWTVEVRHVEGGRTNKAVYRVQSRGYNFLAEMTFPPRRKGNKLLMREGSMWFHKPGLSKAVPISQRQKLLGKASYGDIAATDYSENYTAELLGEGDVAGEACYRFDLRARRKRHVTYDRIEYWVSKSRLVGLKAKYYTVSGKMYKTARMEYGHEVTDGEKTRPFCSRIVIGDALVSSQTTSLDLSAPKLQPVPYSVFNLNRLAR